MNERSELMKIINKHRAVFSDKPWVANTEGHTIILTTNIPIVAKPYKVPYLQRTELSTELQEMGKL